jgi:DegV family protein with EDD domain
VVDTLEYLHKGGRIGGAKRLVGSVLSIKPVLHIENGQIEPLTSVRTKSKAIAHMIEVVLGEMKDKKDIHAGIIHAGAPNDAAYIQQQILAAVRPRELLVNELTPVLGANVGPGVVGMGYYTE